MTGGTRKNCYHLLVQVSTAAIKTRCWLLDHDEICITYLLCALYFCAVFVLVIITGIIDFNFYVIQEFETLNLEIKELKVSIEAGHAQIHTAQETIVQLTEYDGRSKEQVAEAKVNMYHAYPNVD